MKYLTILLLFILSGCSDEWFDVKSNKQTTIPSDLNDLQMLLDDAVLFNAFSPSMGENASDCHFYRDEIFAQALSTERNSYTWSREQPFIGVADWVNSNTGSYGRIYSSNLILEKLNDLGLSEQARSIRGQALFHRAKTYFELAQIFVPLYTKAVANKHLGIPLRLVSDITVKSTRSTVEEIYQQVFKDALESIDYLPNVQDFKTRPSKAAAYALLARIYLSLDNYTESLKYADLSLAMQNKLINYKTLDYLATANPFVGYNEEIIYYSYMAGGSAFTVNGINIVKEFYNSFDDNDLRKWVFFRYDSTADLVTYRGTYAGRGYNFFFTGLATDELYLIRAECLARDGKVTEAMQVINFLLKTRWDPGVTVPAKPYVNITATDAEDALRKILDERKKEMVLRGVRWSDLRRLNKDSRFEQIFSRTIDGKTYMLEPNSYKYTFPIPEDIIQVTGMEQNPGWK